jgi:hypothetical protein
MAAEVALALMLLAGGALLWKSFVRVTGVDLGFQPDRVLVMLVNLPDVRYPDGAHRLTFFQELEQRVSRMPGVQSVAYTFRFPIGGDWGRPTKPLTGQAPSREYTMPILKWPARAISRPWESRF